MSYSHACPPAAANSRSNRTGEYHCFSAQYLIKHVTTPVFSLMSKFDEAQLSVQHIMLDEDQMVGVVVSSIHTLCVGHALSGM